MGALRRSIEVVITSSTRNRVGGNTPRGFESHLLRQMRGPSERTVFLFSLKVGFERRHIATAVAFPQKRNPTFSAKWQHFSEMKGAVFRIAKVMVLEAKLHIGNGLPSLYNGII